MFETPAGLRWSACCGLLLGGFLLAQPSGASISFEGTPDFSIFPQPSEWKGPRDPFTLLITMHGQEYPKDAIGKGKLVLGPNLALISGKLEHVGHPSRRWDGSVDNAWSLTLRATGPGKTEVRAIFEGDVGGQRTDEMEIVLHLDVGADSLTFEGTRIIRQETIRNGQRFRYGGLFLVPIDSPEELPAGGIAERPRVVHQESAVCESCTVGEGQTLPFVVFLDALGAVKATRFYSEDAGSLGASPGMIRSAEEVLKRWRFVPARTTSSAVSDWIIVRVPMRTNVQSP